MSVAVDPQQAYQSGDYRLAPPLPATDLHRIDLHAALIAAGVPPLPGDAWAVRQIAGLDSATVGSVIAWIEASRR